MGVHELIFFSLFIVFVISMLMLDLGVFSRKSHVVSFKEAGLWSVVWVISALIFFFILRTHGDLVHGVDNMDELRVIVDKYAEEINLSNYSFEEAREVYRKKMSIEFITGYLIEYALSVDNIFVILLIFKSFGVREKYYKKVLFWGILGALVMRFIFIFLGSAVISKFEWVLYIFGGFLIYSGIQMLREAGNEEEPIDTQSHPVVRFASKYLKVFPRYVNDRFFVGKEGKVLVTPLFIVVLIIEFTDLIFAVDSVPAIFSITKDPYVVFFGNIFAILGLRSMFFFLANIIHLFHYLKYGLSILLTYIGLKMIFSHYLHEWGFKTEYSLIIILSILGGSILLSLLRPPKKEHVPQAPDHYPAEQQSE